MIALGGILATALTFWINHNIGLHSADESAHPEIVLQLKEIRDTQKASRADALQTAILNMDDRICEDPRNRYYRRELSKMITDWQTLTGQTFPAQLLRCANNGNP